MGRQHRLPLTKANLAITAARPVPATETNTECCLQHPSLEKTNQPPC